MGKVVEWATMTEDDFRRLPKPIPVRILMIKRRKPDLGRAHVHARAHFSGEFWSQNPTHGNGSVSRGQLSNRCFKVSLFTLPVGSLTPSIDYPTSPIQWLRCQTTQKCRGASKKKNKRKQNSDWPPIDFSPPSPADEVADCCRSCWISFSDKDRPVPSYLEAKAKTEHAAIGSPSTIGKQTPALSMFQKSLSKPSALNVKSFLYRKSKKSIITEQPANVSHALVVTVKAFQANHH